MYYPRSQDLSPSQIAFATEKRRLGLMICQPFADRALHKEEINQAALKLSLVLAFVRQFENSFLPVNSLPSGIIALIQTFRESELDLVNATAVCAYWRKSLISTPGLWNNIVCSKNATLDSVTPRVHAYFERSGSIPINVQINAHFSRLISPQTERISQLTMFIDAGTPSGCDEIVEHLSKSAPLLEAVEIYGIQKTRENLEPPPQFPKEFLSSMRTLTLYYALPDPGQNKFSRLTIFTLWVCITEGTWPIVLDTLEQMPLLQVFVASLDLLHDLGPLPKDRVVTLQHLKEITIRLYGNRSCRRVKGLILPAFRLPCARKVIMDLSNFVGYYDAPILPSSVEEQLPCLSGTLNASVYIREGTWPTINFLGPNQSELTLTSLREIMDSLVSSDLSGIPFDGVHQLHISFGGDHLDNYFIKLLQRMRRLECLKMEKRILGPMSEWAYANGQAKICPDLTALTVIYDSSGCLDWLEYCVEKLKWEREHAGVSVPIASVEKQFN